MKTFDRLLVPVDFSESSFQALDAALTLAGQLGAHVDVVHAYEPLNLPALHGAGIIALQGKTQDAQQATRDTLLKVVNKAAEQHPKTVAHFREGTAVESILDSTKELQSDLIVMSSHGLSGIRQILMGSVAKAVLKQSNVPVLMVRSSASNHDIDKFAAETAATVVD